MATRLSVIAATISAAVAVPMVAPLFASAEEQGVPVPQVENAKFFFEGKISGANVRVRSGPNENYYETDRLSPGSPVTVVGIKYEWLKIIPPPGSFSVVAKASVRRSADGKTGTSTVDGLSVRAGSKLNSMKVTVQCRLKKGDTVEILGEQDEYYQVKPPREAFLYVNQKFVTPVKQLASASAAFAQPRADSTNTTPEPRDNEPIVAANQSDTATSDTATAAPDVQPGTTSSPERSTSHSPAPKVTKPQEVAIVVSPESEFDRLNTEWDRAMAKPLEEMPTAELLASYEKLLGDQRLPISMRRTADVRAASLRIKNRAKEEYLSTMRQQNDAMLKIEALRQQRAIVEQRIESGVEVFTAVGLLQPSTLQVGAITLYRLTDPSTGRSLCYVRSDDARYLAMIGRFVGVKGDLGNDNALTLKVVTAEEIAPVDPSRVNRGVSAQITPPSLSSFEPTQAATTAGN